MLNFLINFSIITFTCYAVAFPVREILFCGKSKQRCSARKSPKRQAKIISLRKYSEKNRGESQSYRLAG